MKTANSPIFLKFGNAKNHQTLLNFASWFHLTNHRIKTTIYVGRWRATWNPLAGRMRPAGRGLDSTALVGDLCKQLETTEAMTSAYHPQINGLTGTWHMRSQLSHNTRNKHAAYYNYYNQHWRGAPWKLQHRWREMTFWSWTVKIVNVCDFFGRVCAIERIAPKWIKIDTK